MFKIYIIESNLNSKHQIMLDKLQNSLSSNFMVERITSQHEICARFNVTRFPTILLTKNERFLSKMTGIFTLDRYIDFIESSIPKEYH